MYNMQLFCMPLNVSFWMLGAARSHFEILELQKGKRYNFIK